MRHYPSAKDLAKITKPGRYAVGHGAYLQIAVGGTRSWLFRYRVGDQQHHMGLGSCDYVSLQEARDKAIDAQRLRIQGGDPLEAKRATRRPTGGRAYEVYHVQAVRSGLHGSARAWLAR